MASRTFLSSVSHPIIISLTPLIIAPEFYWGPPSISSLEFIIISASPAILLLDYFSVFGTKSCCFDDLRSYLEFFSPDEIKKFMVMAEAKVAENPINFDCSEKDRKRNVSILRRQISMMQLQRYCGLHGNLSLDKKRDLVLLCKHLYREGLKLATGVPETDTKPADFFVVLAVHVLIEIYVETREWRVLWQAILLLEHSRGQKTANPQILLLLLKLYGFLGAAEGITGIFESLSIKHLLMETLGYIPLRYLQASGSFGFTNQLYRSALRFYYSCAKEVWRGPGSGKGVWLKERGVAYGSC
jgi:N-terminal acetyltransferase B complex non-catalytic subunit